MDKKGFSLLEVMVSIFIISFVIIGMLRLYALGEIQSQISKHKVMAVNIAESEIERLKNLTYENITASLYPVSQIVIIDTGSTNGAGDDLTGTMVSDILVIAEGYKVIITVTWADYYGTITEVLESVITPYL